MFSSKKRLASTSAMETLIGRDSTVEGKVICKTSLRIDGHVHGDVECTGDVSLGKEAVLYSTITARNVINSGTVHGAIRTKGALSIASTGKMYGDISVGSLHIASGGVFEGTSKMQLMPESATTKDSTHEVNAQKPRLHKIEGSSSSASAASNAPSSTAKSSSAR